MRKKITIEIGAEMLRTADVMLALMRAQFMLTAEVIHASPSTTLHTTLQGVEIHIVIEEVK